MQVLTDNTVSSPDFGEEALMVATGPRLAWALDAALAPTPACWLTGRPGEQYRAALGTHQATGRELGSMLFWGPLAAACSPELQAQSR